MMRFFRPLVAALFVSLIGLAEPATAQLTFQLRTGNDATSSQSMTIDSNRCPTQGPTAMYVGGVLRNSSTTTTVNNIVATLAGLNANVGLAGGQTASQAIGSLGPGQSIGVYWFTSFLCAPGASATPVVQVTSSAAPLSRNLTLTIRSAISANAGGQVISATLGPGAVVGQNVYFDASYDFGGTALNDEYFLQPAGGPNFNAACFRLVGSQILGSNLNAAPAGTIDQLYFRQPGAQPGNGYFINVRYIFQYLCAGVSSVARPYAVQTSGNTNIKYTGNFDGTGSITITYPGATNPFTIAKTVSEANAFVGTPGTLTYTVTVTNPSVHASVISQINDTLPAGMTFAGLAPASQVTAANSSSIPAVGASGALAFVGRVGQSYAIAPGGSVTLAYFVNRPPGTGTFVNSAQGVFGQATTPVATATYNQVTPVPLTASKTSLVVSDPVNAATNPKAIPGAVIQYDIGVNNPNPLPVDSNSVIVSDPTPANLRFCVTDIGSPGSGPISFVNGSPPAGLSFSFLGLASTADSVEFSNDNGATWTYVPVPDATGCDPAVTHFRVRPAGAFSGSGQFSLRARYRLL